MAPIGSDVEANLIHDEPQTDAQTQETDAEEEPEIEEPQMSVYMTIGLLVVVTVVSSATMFSSVRDEIADTTICYSSSRSPLNGL